MKVPELMRDLPVDSRGLPVPYVVLTDAQGKPRFQINDSEKVEVALRKGRCAICGQTMPAHDQWLVGGPASAFHPQGAYIDTPTHYACLRYALQMCPHLAGGRVQHLDADTLNQKGKLGPGIQVKDPTQDAQAVPFFVAVRIGGYQVVRPGPNKRYVVAQRPFLYIEYWKEGQQLTPQQASTLWRQHAQAQR